MKAWMGLIRFAHYSVGAVCLVCASIATVRGWWVIASYNAFFAAYNLLAGWAQ